jgi:poly [ADP-ribose] polymerase
MEDKDPETKLIKKLICTTANARNFNRLKLFKCWRRDEISSFTEFEGMKNRQLLFHGTTLTNYLSILSQGLVVAPEGVQKAGDAFGKAIYFADMFAKSDNYSSNQRLNVNVGQTPQIMLLCEVALGNIKKSIYAQEYTKESLRRGFEKYDSVKVYGRKGPDHKHARMLTPQGFGVTATLPVDAPLILESELIKYDIPKDQLENLKRWTYNRPQIQQSGASIYQVEYNEYVLFNPAQVKIRYLIQYQ